MRVDGLSNRDLALGVLRATGSDLDRRSLREVPLRDETDAYVLELARVRLDASDEDWREDEEFSGEMTDEELAEEEEFLREMEREDQSNDPDAEDGAEEEWDDREDGDDDGEMTVEELAEEEAFMRGDSNDRLDFDPDQPRDEDGKWGAGGFGGGGGGKDKSGGGKEKTPSSKSSKRALALSESKRLTSEGHNEAKILHEKAAETFRKQGYEDLAKAHERASLAHGDLENFKDNPSLSASDRGTRHAKESLLRAVSEIKGLREMHGAGKRPPEPRDLSTANATFNYNENRLLHAMASDNRASDKKIREVTGMSQNEILQTAEGIRKKMGLAPGATLRGHAKDLVTASKRQAEAKAETGSNFDRVTDEADRLARDGSVEGHRKAAELLRKTAGETKDPSEKGSHEMAARYHERRVENPELREFDAKARAQGVDTARSREELVSAYKEAGRGVSEHSSESDHRAAMRTRAKIQGEIDAIDAAKKEGREATASERSAAARARAAEFDLDQTSGRSKVEEKQLTQAQAKREEVGGQGAAPKSGEVRKSTAVREQAAAAIVRAREARQALKSAPNSKELQDAVAKANKEARSLRAKARKEEAKERDAKPQSERVAEATAKREKAEADLQESLRNSDDATLKRSLASVSKKIEAAQSGDGKVAGALLQRDAIQKEIKDRERRAAERPSSSTEGESPNRMREGDKKGVDDAAGRRAGLEGESSGPRPPLGSAVKLARRVTGFRRR